MPFAYKCVDTKNCGQRVTLKKKKEEYIKERRCKACGRKIYLQPDVKRRGKEHKCNCGVRPYPHKHDKWCVGNESLLMSNYECYEGMCKGWW